MVSWASNSTALFWKSRRLVSTSDRKFNHSRGTTYFWETSSTWNRMWVDFWDRYMIMKIGENLVHDCKQYSAPQAKILGFKSIISVWKRCKTAENFAYNFHISESKDTKESRSDSLVSEYSYKWVEKISRRLPPSTKARAASRRGLYFLEITFLGEVPEKVPWDQSLEKV